MLAKRTGSWAGARGGENEGDVADGDAGGMGGFGPVAGSEELDRLAVPLLREAGGAAPVVDGVEDVVREVAELGLGGVDAAEVGLDVPEEEAGAAAGAVETAEGVEGELVRGGLTLPAM